VPFRNNIPEDFFFAFHIFTSGHWFSAEVGIYFLHVQEDWRKHLTLEKIEIAKVIALMEKFIH